uniref:Putative secreted protein n=1 Tax=Anopheles triannulatus TaxID=58253 RepID=A0A2M4B5Q7_9DIPT
MLKTPLFVVAAVLFMTRAGGRARCFAHRNTTSLFRIHASSHPSCNYATNHRHHHHHRHPHLWSESRKSHFPRGLSVGFFLGGGKGTRHLLDWTGGQVCA